jgi:hypothetical protein
LCAMPVRHELLTKIRKMKIRGNKSRQKKQPPQEGRLPGSSQRAAGF